MKTIAFAIAVFGASNFAFADGTITWLWDVTTANGDSLVEPGETANITLIADLSPDVNFPDGPVLGFAATVFDLLGGSNAQLGVISDWKIIGIDGLVEQQLDYDLLGVTIAQSTGQDFFSPADPISLFEFEWTPQTYDHYQVSYSTATTLMRAWEGTEEVPFLVDWTSIDASIDFLVVPSPPSLLLWGTLGIVAVSAHTRRRR